MATHRFLKRRGAMTSSPVRILGRVLNVRAGSDIDHHIFLTRFLLPYAFLPFFSSFNTFQKLSLAFSLLFSFLVGCLIHILSVLCLLYLLSANPYTIYYSSMTTRPHVDKAPYFYHSQGKTCRLRNIFTNKHCFYINNSLRI